MNHESPHAALKFIASFPDLPIGRRLGSFEFLKAGSDEQILARNRVLLVTYSSTLRFFNCQHLLVGLLSVFTLLTMGLRATAADGAGNETSIIVAYVPGTTSKDIAQIERKYGLHVLEILGAANSRVYRIPSAASREKILADLGKEKSIRYAEADQIVTKQEELK